MLKSLSRSEWCRVSTVVEEKGKGGGGGGGSWVGFNQLTCWPVTNRMEPSLACITCRKTWSRMRSSLQQFCSSFIWSSTWWGRNTSVWGLENKPECLKYHREINMRSCCAFNRNSTLFHCTILRNPNNLCPTALLWRRHDCPFSVSYWLELAFVGWVG